MWLQKPRPTLSSLDELRAPRVLEAQPTDGTSAVDADAGCNEELCVLELGLSRPHLLHAAMRQPRVCDTGLVSGMIVALRICAHSLGSRAGRACAGDVRPAGPRRAGRPGLEWLLPAVGAGGPLGVSTPGAVERPSLASVEARVAAAGAAAPSGSSRRPLCG